MDSGTLAHIVAMTLTLAAKIAAPPLLTALVVGLIISLFQAVTQINDSTLGFLPKLVCVFIAFWLCLPWITQEIVAYTTQIFQMMERLPR